MTKSQIDALEKNQPAEFEEYFPTLDRWLRVTVTPGPQGFVTLFRDSSEVRRAEEALQETRTGFRLMVQRVKD